MLTFVYNALSKMTPFYSYFFYYMFAAEFLGMVIFVIRRRVLNV